ncbi:phosphatase PAP2 family protein [Flavobacterium jejuense]|uniref:Phosphatase PAP2 family protein n=1 Tax=Flavobacterium jejuense TaxID=1544455 RepID=A0ABX0IUD5_9FLAO|nr:phosphatase PAP2 family protein [Flavobacterium jejuense]NHN26449.1 phosphatase PAP2 family protein [Flavobacterium jejuense]
MLEHIISLDKELLVFLNGLGSEKFDPFWLLITKQLNWIPYFLILLFILQKKIGWRNLGIALLFIALLITFTDQVTNLFKNHFQRLRPCKDLEINTIIRLVKCSDTYSFFSGHASNSSASMTFIFLVLRKYYKFAFVVFLFPLIFAYSRIYLGLHFPGDILTGYCFGVSFGIVFYKLYAFVLRKYFKVLL